MNFLNMRNDINFLYVLMIRNLLRVFRKKLASYSDFYRFKNDLLALIDIPEYNEAIRYVDWVNLNKGQKFTLNCIKSKRYKLLYLLARLELFKIIK